MEQNKNRDTTTQVQSMLPRLRRVAAVLLAVSLIFLIWEMTKIPWSNLQDYLPKSPVASALVLLGIYIIKTVLIVIPLNALYLSASLLFPTFWAIAISYLGLVLEMTAGFWIGRKGGNGVVRARIERYKFSRWLLSMTETHPVLSCFLFRFLPPPADVTNIFLGASKVGYLPFLFSSLLGFTPKLLTVVLAGEAVAVSHHGTFAILAGILLTLEIIPAIILYFVRKRKNN